MLCDDGDGPVWGTQAGGSDGMNLAAPAVAVGLDESLSLCGPVPHQSKGDLAPTPQLALARWAERLHGEARSCVERRVRAVGARALQLAPLGDRCAAGRRWCLS